MKFILNRLYQWIPEFGKLSIEKQKEILVSLTYEVEEISPLAKISGVKVGFVESCEKHPNSDRLSFCRVNSAGQTWDVVCGGKNVATGQVVAHALPGSKVGDMLMAPKELRGIVSNGMILSIAEIIGLEKNIIETHNQGNIEIFDKKLLNTNKEQEDILKELCADGNYVDIKVLPDRQYVKSYLNLAMEISAITGFELKLPMFEYKHTLKNDLSINSKYKTHYIAKFKEVNHTSRTNIKIRLYLEGIQPKDNIEDNISYIKLLTGIEVKVTKHNDYYTAEVFETNTNTNEHFYKYALDLFLSIGMTQNKNISECSEIIGHEQRTFRKIEVEKDFITNFIGQQIDILKLSKKFEKLNFNILDNGDNFVFEVPHYRNDVNTKQEIIEEIVRLYGINNISTKSMSNKDQVANNEWNINLKNVLSQLGLHEIKTYQLIEENQFDRFNIWHQKEKVKLDSSYTNKYNTFKSTLLSTLIDVYTYNYRKEEHQDLAFFEIQHILINGEQKTSIGIIHDDNFKVEEKNPILTTKALMNEILKNIGMKDVQLSKIAFENNVFNPFQSAQIMNNNKVIGYIGELHPSILREQKLIRVDKVKSKLYFVEIIL